MLPSFVLALREGVEAALVIGILLSVLRKLQRTELSLNVWWGVLVAFITSVLVAAGFTVLGASLEDPAEAIFEGLTMLAAAGLLTWMIFWMQRQSRFLRGKIEHEVRQALNQTSGRALFGVAFLAVVREGIELALFLSAAGMASNPGQELAGSLMGLIVAAGLGWMLFSSTRRLPLGKFFQVTNVLLILFAAGLVSQGVHELNDIGWIPMVVGHVYNLNPFLYENSALGQVFKALFGYTASPSLTETLAYLVYFTALALGLFGFRRRAVADVAQRS